MTKRLFLSSALSFCAAITMQAQNSISLESEIPPGHKQAFIELSSSPAESVRIGYTSEKTKSEKLKITEKIVRWELQTNDPTLIWGPLIGKRFVGITLEPRDKIKISYRQGKPFYSGKGSEKMQLAYNLEQINDSIMNLPACKDCFPTVYRTSSLEDYLHWNDRMNKRLGLMLAEIEKFRSKLTDYTYNNVMDRVLTDIEVDRIEKFQSLCGKPNKEGKKNAEGELLNTFGLTNKDLTAIYDSTIAGRGVKWLEYERPFVNDPNYLLAKTTSDAHRRKGKFFRSEDNLPIIEKGVNLYVELYELGKEKYSGMIRESYLSFILWYVRGVIHGHGFTPEVESLLSDYYAGSISKKHSDFVKKVELEYRERYNMQNAPDFALTDTAGNIFSSTRLKGKIALVDFWFTGCVGCVEMASALRKVEEQFKADTNIVFLNVSVDENREKWLTSIKKKKFTSGAGIQLYTGGKGYRDEMIKKYGVTGYPTLLLIDPYNKVTWSNNIPNPRKDQGAKLTGLLQKHLALLKDGPYVIHNNDSLEVYSFNGANFRNEQFSKNSLKTLRVQTDQVDKFFDVSIKQSSDKEPCRFTQPEKLFVFSDIEGNFDALRKLLQSNKIIDNNYEWAFGNGHLVFAGDMFDRGQQVTECLWLIYSLEEKAKKAGGYVHFILGNHELSNLRGNERYVQQKYKDNAATIGKSLASLYTEDTELGQWLRTKNIVEKIGDLLVTHGGISKQVYDISLSLEQINELARPNYAFFKTDYGKKEVNLIMGPDGPFSYRYYYETGSKKTPEAVIDSVLKRYEVKHIITGHTITADTISTHYNQRVINTDTRHAVGKSEALLIDGNDYFRVNGGGLKVLLFTAKPPENTVLNRRNSQSPRQ